MWGLLLLYGKFFTEILRFPNSFNLKHPSSLKSPMLGVELMPVFDCYSDGVTLKALHLSFFLVLNYGSLSVHPNCHNRHLSLGTHGRVSVSGYSPILLTYNLGYWFK